MKFHKVGSESVQHFFLHSRSRLKYSWKQEVCNLPFGHEILNLYMQHGREGLIEKCITSHEKFCRISMTTIIRDPLEKFVSYLYHFKSDILARAHVNSNEIARDTMEMIFNHTSKSISLHQMSELVLHSKRWNIHQPIFFISRNFLNDSLHSVIENITQDMYEKAVHNMKQDFEAVGVMEWMPSFFTLVSKVYDLDVSLACGLHFDHGSSVTYQNVYGSSSRPSADTLFSPEVIQYLKEDVFPWDIKFINDVKDLHINQLGAIGMNVASAEEYFHGVCQAKLKPKI